MTKRVCFNTGRLRALRTRQLGLVGAVRLIQLRNVIGRDRGPCDGALAAADRLDEAEAVLLQDALYAPDGVAPPV